MTNLSKQRELFDWLHSLDLAHHFDHFVENGYEDLEICREIGESDLQAIGVCDIHERISLLQAIRHSRQVQSTTSFSNSSTSNNCSNNTRDRDNYISSNYNYSERDGEPLYESVLPFGHDYESVPDLRNSGRCLWPNSTLQSNPRARAHQHLQNSNSLHANLIPRPQLRDQVRMDGINISRIPDEMTLGALATQYACELASSSEQQAGEFLTFQAEIHHQLREMWLEERRKLVSSTGFCSTTTLHGGSQESPVKRHPPPLRNSRNSRKTPSNPSNVPSGPSNSGWGKPSSSSSSAAAAHHPVPVPTVSGIVSASGGGGSGHPSFLATAEQMFSKSPEHRHQHQYLQHIIISNENGGHGHHGYASSPMNGNGMTAHIEERPIYTPGIYLPSSCLLDKDEIYDYAPPLPRNHQGGGGGSPSKRSLQSPFKSKAKSKSALSCHHGGTTAFTSPSRRQYATIRNAANNKSISRSVSLNVNHVSPTYVNTSSFMEGDLSHSSPSHGCRTLTNLSKLSRRLGLSRLFRTFRAHGMGNGGNSCQNSKLMTMSTTGTTTTARSGTGRSSTANHQLVSRTQKAEENVGTSSCTLSSLPSNERIIETINRLKYEELQRRKERIAQEHQLILKELKNSMSPSTNSSEGPSSIFYVSNSNGTDEEVGASVSSPLHRGQQQQSILYEDPPYENTAISGSNNVEGSAIEQHFQGSNINSQGAKSSGAGMGSKHSKSGSGSEGKERRSWNETGSYQVTLRDPASNRTSSSSNYHSNSTSDSISSTEVNGLGLGPENSCRNGGRRGRTVSENAGCELLSSSVGGGGGGDSSTASSTTNSSRGSQTEHFLSQQHLQREQNQHLRLSQTAAEDEERENSFTATQQPKTLFGKVKDFGSKSRRRLSSKPSSGSLANGLGPRNDSPFNFDETRKSNGDGNEGDEDGREGRGSSSNEMTPYRSKAVDIVGGVGRNSSEEELTSITNSQSGGLGSLSLSETEEYNGPFVGRALAVVDCMPSPYDRHALRYKKGDLIEIISKKPTGLWTGKVNGQVGHFKFINVEILPDESDGEEEEMEDEASNMYERPGDHRNRQAHSYLPVRRRNKRMTAMTPWEMEQRQTVANVINGIRKENAALSQHSKSLDSESPFRAVQSRTGRRKSSAAAASLKKGRPKSVGDLLRRINLEEYISVFILHGFESLDLFKELEEEDLDRLAISNPSDRAKILTIVELLREFDSEAEIPPIIIPTYSCPSQLDGMDVADPEGSDLHQIIAPPDSFTRTSGAGGQKFGTIVRDSGVFVKCDDQEDPEIEEIILSPVNLRIDASPCRNYDGSSTNMNPSSIFLGRLSNPNPGNMKQFPARSFPSSQAYPETGENIPMSTKTNDQWTDNVEQYCAVRQRFLQAKSLFESGVTSPGGTPQGLDVGGPNSQKNRFLFCEKSSDSGISVGANSPPPNRNE